MKNKEKAGWGSLVRLLDYMWKQYKFVLLLAAVLIVAKPPLYGLYYLLY